MPKISKYAKPAPVNGKVEYEKDKVNREHEERMAKMLQDTLDLWDLHKPLVVEVMDLCVSLQRWVNMQAVNNLNKPNDKKKV